VQQFKAGDIVRHNTFGEGVILKSEMIQDTDGVMVARADLGVARRHPELLEEACQLRLELPARSAAQISAILLARHGIRVAERTVRQPLQQRGLHRAALAQQPRVFGRFEAARPNELWVGDVLIGPYVPWPRTPTSRRAFRYPKVGHWTGMRSQPQIRPERFEVRPDLEGISFSEGGPRAWFSVVRREG